MTNFCFFFFFQAEDGIRDTSVTGVQTCALPIWQRPAGPVRDLPARPARMGFTGDLMACEVGPPRRTAVDSLRRIHIRTPGQPCGPVRRHRGPMTLPTLVLPLLVGLLPSAQTWCWPLPPPHHVVRGFDPPIQPWLAGHRGVDLAGAPGAPVLAAR